MAALLCCSMPASADKAVRHFEIKEQLDQLEVSAGIEVIYTPTNVRDGMRFRLELSLIHISEQQVDFQTQPRG